MRVVGAAARALAWMGAVFLIAMMLVSVADVALRATLNSPVTGTIEIVELCLAGAGFLAIAHGFMLNDHIAVDVMDTVLPAGVVVWLKRIAALATVLFLMVLVYRIVPPVLDSYDFNDITADLELPMVIHGVIIFAGIVAAVAGSIVLFLREMSRLDWPPEEDRTL